MFQNISFIHYKMFLLQVRWINGTLLDIGKLIFNLKVTVTVTLN